MRIVRRAPGELDSDQWNRALRTAWKEVHGTEQSEGSDYSVHGREIVFSRPLVKERVSGARWLAMFLGLFGSYGENETVDVHFRRGGATQVISDAEIVP